MPNVTLIMAAIAVLVIPAAPIPAVISLLPVGAVAGIGTAIAVIAIRSVVAGVVPASTIPTLTMTALADPATAVLATMIALGLPTAMIPVLRERRTWRDREGRSGRERCGSDDLAQHGNSPWSPATSAGKGENKT